MFESETVKEPPCFKILRYGMWVVDGSTVHTFWFCVVPNKFYQKVEQSMWVGGWIWNSIQACCCTCVTLHLAFYTSIQFVPFKPTICATMNTHMPRIPPPDHTMFSNPTLACPRLPKPQKTLTTSRPCEPIPWVLALNLYSSPRFSTLPKIFFLENLFSRAVSTLC